MGSVLSVTSCVSGHNTCALTNTKGGYVCQSSGRMPLAQVDPPSYKLHMSISWNDEGVPVVVWCVWEVCQVLIHIVT